MAFSFPLTSAVLSDILPVESVVWDSNRSDEFSGSGDARTWQTNLADPLWTAEVGLVPRYHADIKEIAAVIRKLQGAKHCLELVDPISPYPKMDPDGSILGASAVTISAIAVNRQSVTLAGLPVGYVLTRGDKAHADYSSSPSRRYFFEISETVTANGSGNATFEVYPTVPLLLNTSTAVTLKKPSCRGFIMPGTFKPGTATDMFTRGAGFTFMERR